MQRATSPHSSAVLKGTQIIVHNSFLRMKLALLQVLQARKAKQRRAHIGCVCGVDDSSPDAEDYDGLWLQCSGCLAWMHGACVGHPRRAPAGETWTLST